MSKEFEERYSGKSITDVATIMRDLKSALDNLSAEKSAIQKEYDYLRLNTVPTLMDEDGVSTLTIIGVGRVGLTADLYASIPAEKRPKAWQWLRDNGHGDLITETVNGSTFKAFCKGEIKKGKVLPEDLFKITPFTRAAITKIS